MMAKDRIRGRLLQIGGCCLLATSAGVPVAMSSVSVRAHDFAKLLTLVPLATIGFILVTSAVGWRAISGGRWIERLAALAMVAFVVMACFSTAMSDAPMVAFIGRFYRPEGLSTWCAYAAFFFGLLIWQRFSGRANDFVDVILLTSLVPAAYAVQQWLGFDFYSTPGIEGRSIGTQGGPGLLGGYLATMLIVTLDRFLTARGWSLARSIWLVVLIFQVLALWLTHARGPWLAAFLGCTLLGILVCLEKGARRGVWLSVLAMPMALALVMSINVYEPLQRWAQTVPGLNRVVFDLAPQATQATSLSSRSIVSRLGTWQAGEDAFVAASWRHRLFGFGPESAQPAFFPHIPASVMAAEDFRTVQNFDRLHAQSLDMILNFGVIGWVLMIVVMSCAVLAGARRLYGEAAGSGRELAFFIVLCSAVAMGCAFGAGQGALAGPAMGMGIAAGWAVYLCGSAGRRLKRSQPKRMAEGASTGLPVTGLVVGLIVFWVDAQVNFALLTGHLVAFSLAALLIGEGERSTVAAPDVADIRAGIAHPWAFEFGIAMLIAVTLSGFFAPFATPTAQSIREVCSRLAIPAMVLALATAVLWSRAGGFERPAFRRWIPVMAGVPTIYMVLHLGVRPELIQGFEIPFVEEIAATRLAIVGFAVLVALGYGGWLAGSARVDLASRRSSSAIVGFGAAVLLLASFAPVAWRALVADVAAGSVHLVAREERATIDELVEIAVKEASWEWRHHNDRIYRRLGYALAKLGPGGVAPDQSQEFMRELGKAEVAATTGMERFANEPWAVLAMAKVSQVRGLNVLRSLYPESGAIAARDAGEQYATAHRMFPAQPLVLHGWAQVSFDNGALSEGYGLLDQMEAIVPREPEPYVERLAAALRGKDEATVSATLARAGTMLQPAQMRELDEFVALRKRP